MGGSAFNAILPASALPRIPPAVYYAMKARMTPRLQTLYSIVSTPPEAPEKQDHGDLDFLVCEPLKGDVTHDEVKAVLNATYVIPMPGNRTSSYAVPVERDERWNETEETYYQVDVHVCADKAEWERIHFFHGYGDLGMIMGLISRNKGLQLGSTGLKIPNPPRPPFYLSESMDEIMQYLGLSMEQWKAGFKTKQQVFEWAGTCSLFDPATFRTAGEGINKVKPERTMYAQFAQWVEEQKQHLDDSETPSRVFLEKDERIQHALKYFGKKEQFDALAREDAVKARIKESFNGVKVRAWTGLSGAEWKDLKATMDQVRAWTGGEAGIVKILDEQGEEGIKELVLRAKEVVSLRATENTAQEVSAITKELEAVLIAETPVV
ncbi:hypothetical protein B0H17DRAFT_1095723 [Mycena rosella]|uniref:Uncharacterized protein n=1 Tax=Mycena rosella TaxID=1033263 RepID=A0AAD7CRM4_MYCRO|nr:hypothetical protein B0H17DRAFT_1095723 [Mycena rosella]